MWISIARVPAAAAQTFCQACRLNRTIPDLGLPENLLRWQRLEAAKHRLVYSLLRLGLPFVICAFTVIPLAYYAISLRHHGRGTVPHRGDLPRSGYPDRRSITPYALCSWPEFCCVVALLDCTPEPGWR